MFRTNNVVKSFKYIFCKSVFYGYECTYFYTKTSKIILIITVSKRKVPSLGARLKIEPENNLAELRLTQQYTHIG
jgi:hypothetical protein